ncbi:MAG: ABC transporter permease [Pseudomonadota bacterium]
MFKVKLIAFQTIVMNEIHRFSRLWMQTLLPPMITMTLYFVIFGSLIGSRVGKMEGVPFMQFMAPGLIMMSIITNSYANVVSSFYGIRFQRSVEELLVSPTPNSLILLGYTIGGVIRGIITGIIITIIALFFTNLHVQHIFITMTIVILTALLFSLAGFLNAVYSKSFDDITIIPTFVLTPLTYLGGVFYSIHQLPDAWRDVSLANPVLYIVNTFRYGILGITDVHIAVAFVIIFLCVIGLYALNLRLLNKGVGIRT